MTQLSSSDVPGMGRRQFMNLLTFGSVTGVALGALYPVANYFIPPKAAGSGGGTSAKDELGNAITASGWLASHPEGDRSLVQGLKGDPTYLIVEGEDAVGEHRLGNFSLGQLFGQMAVRTNNLAGGLPGAVVVLLSPEGVGPAGSRGNQQSQSDD